MYDLAPRRFLSLLVLLLALGTATTRLKSAEDKVASWPRFHGPLGTNLAAETGLLRQWPEGGPRRLWTATGIGEGFATVAIAEGRIYTAGNRNGQTVITVLDAGGQLLWQVPNGGAWTGSQPGSRGTPTIEGDRLYHESPLGDVVCLDAASGRKIWGLNVLEKFGSENITWALAESLLIDGDRLICCPGGPQTAVVALDKRTGQTVWKSPSADGDRAGYASPALAVHPGLRMVLTMTSRHAIGVNADTGGLLWRFEHVTPWDENIFSPIFHDGHVFISTGHRVGSVMLKVTVQGQQANVREVWRSTNLDNHHGGVILLDGYLYGSRWSSGWACLEWKSGKTMYNERGVGKGSLTYADGMLYTLGENGLMGLVPATPQGHTLVSRFQLPAGGEGPAWAHPVVCGGRLYLRHGDFLYAYDVRRSDP
jgi:outer membrane protein assembly factor BamB